MMKNSECVHRYPGISLLVVVLLLLAGEGLALAGETNKLLPPNASPAPASANEKTSSALIKKTSTMMRPRPQPRTLEDLQSGRPLLAVGTLKSLDMASLTVVVAIDRSLSKMPPVLLHQAKVAKLDKQIVEQEFPAERMFKLRPNTWIIDARPNAAKPQTLAVTGKIRNDKQFLPLSAFKPGERVGVYYRMNPNPDNAVVLNFSKLDPQAKNFPLGTGPRNLDAFFRNRKPGEAAPLPNANDKVTTH